MAVLAYLIKDNSW